MMWFGLLLLLALAMVAIFVLRNQYKSIADPMKTAAVRMAMADNASAAITEAREEFGVLLDQTLASIQSVDDILGQLRERDQLPALELTVYATRLGSYVGETINRPLNADWSFVNPPVDPMTIPLILPDGTRLYHVRWCPDSIVEAGSSNIQRKLDEIGLKT